MEKQIYIIKNRGIGLISELTPENLFLIEENLVALHNDMELQGGDENGNYYHLSQQDYNNITQKNIGIWESEGIFTAEFNNTFH